METPWIPPSANAGTAVIFCVLLTAVLHLVLVKWRPLTKRQWKKVDYIWLGFAALGFITTATEVRKTTAESQSALFRDRARFRADDATTFANELSKSSGALCRQFVRSEYSPPPEEFQRIQSEYDKTCDWAKAVFAYLKAHSSEIGLAGDPTHLVSIRLSDLPARPSLRERELLEMTGDLEDKVGSYNSAVAIVERLVKLSQRTDLDWSLLLLAPYLLAIALAIRLTKVTGEVRLEPH